MPKSRSSANDYGVHWYEIQKPNEKLAASKLGGSSLGRLLSPSSRASGGGSGRKKRKESYGSGEKYVVRGGRRVTRTCAGDASEQRRSSE